MTDDFNFDAAEMDDEDKFWFDCSRITQVMYVRLINEFWSHLSEDIPHDTCEKLTLMYAQGLFFGNG